MEQILRNNKYSNLLFSVLLLLLFQQTLFAQQAGVSPSLSHFAFDVPNNTGKFPERIVCDIHNTGAIVGVIPSGTTLSGLVATFTADAADSVLVNGVRQQSQSTANDFSAPVTYTLYAGGSRITEYTVSLVQTGLPVIYVNTVNEAPIVSKDDYVAGRVKVITTTGAVDLEANTDIRGRGNSTWEMPKKPYRLRLNTRASIFGYPADRDWVLLANYSDKTLSRTTLAFALGQEFGLAYNNRTQPVELVINGVYQGSYLFGEHVKVAPGRVNVTELSEEDEHEEVITGGYFLEIDQRLDEDYWFFSSRGVPLTIKSPGDITTKQLDYIRNYINEMESVLFSESFSDPENGYEKYIDVESFIRWYWVNEIFKNHDARSFSSIFLYKERNQKLKMGPLWDFDISAGNINYGDSDNPTGWWVKTGTWLERLFQDPAFAHAAESFWNSHRDELRNLLMKRIDEYAALLARSQEQNFRKWPILDIYVWPNAVVTGSYAGEIKYLKDWLTSRIDWINAQIAPGDGKISPYLTWDSPAPVFAGTVLSATQLNATATYADTAVTGTFVYTPEAGTVLGAGSGQQLQVTFTPGDTVTYRTVTKTVTINVLDSGQAFYRAININGPELVIDGNAWEASGSAPGFSAANALAFSDQSVALSPATDADRASMIRSSLWGNNVELSLASIPTGSYTVYVYVWEDNFAEVFSLSLEGTVVESTVNSGAPGSWAKLGPYVIDITDGTLNVAATGGAANLSGLEIWCEDSVTAPPPMPFYRAININGPSVVLDGNNWEASDTATGFSATNAIAFSNQAVTLSPATDADRANMIRSSLWGTNIGISLDSIPSGSYQVYLYVWEDNNPEVFSVSLEGVVMQSDINSGPMGTWTKLGPYAVDILDGTLNIVATGGAANLSGLEIYGQGSVTPAPPTAFHRAININGPSLVIDGNNWEASSTAGGFSATNATAFSNQSVALTPATDTDRATMIRSSLWGHNVGVSLGSMPPGNYEVYLYVWEDNSPEVFSISIEDRIVESSINSGPAGSWTKLGPYPVEITDGVLNVLAMGGAANLSGLEIWSTDKASASARMASAQDDQVYSDVDESIALTAYPNPFTDVITVQFTGKESAPAQLVMFDGHGRQVRQVVHEGVSKGRTEAVQLRAGDMPNGVYLLQLVNGSYIRHIRVSLLR